MQDFYRVLGIERDASNEDIKKAYRKLAMQFHPDRNPGNSQAEHKFKEVNQAYEVLKDSQKRAAYDRFGHAAFEGGGDGGFGGGNTGFADIFEEMFGDFMGGGRRGGRSSGRGADLRYNLEVTLEEAFTGKQAAIRVPTSVSCEACDGRGSEGGSQPVSCPACHGAGRVRSQSGFFTVERTCPNCGGTGQIIRNPCRTCSGSGRMHKEKSLQVSIPAGVEDGTRIRLTGEGEAGLRGGPAGDLYIFVTVSPHRFFVRDGTNVFCRVPIRMTTAILGGTVEVPTLDGTRARINVPAGTQTGRQFRLKAKGMPVLRSAGRGDLYIEAMVETPVDLTERQIQLLREFEEAGNEETHSPQSHGFFAKVKELWEELRD
ncbi:MAG: molecular chaperone DnaJ [Rhodospirillales bacterium]|nr:molecular chaperone DnaJ [Rhodospirillales bacterium]